MQAYFAAEPPYSEQLARRLMRKVDLWYEALPSLRAYQRAKRCRQVYYGLPSDASPFDVTTVGEAGEQGELTAVNINRFSQLGRRILTMTVQEDFGWQPIASNADTQSQEDAIIASSVLEHEKRAQRLYRVLTGAAEAALLDGSAWFAVRWDSRAGEKYDRDPRTGQDVYEGRLWVTNHEWWRTPVDLRRKDAKHDWCILTDFLNKYDLAARYPVHAEAVLRLAPDHRTVLEWQEYAENDSPWSEDNVLVPVYTLFHRATPAVPKGREVIFVNPQVVLYDGPSVYGPELPAFRMAPAEWLSTPHGTTPMVDIVSIQNVYNKIVSGVVTNVVNGGVANIAMPREANLSFSQLDGANVWQYDGAVAPEAITTTGNNSESANLITLLGSLMPETIGLNDVALGRQQHQMSGSLAALLDSKAREAATPFIKAVKQGAEDLGTAIVDRYKRFAKAPRALEVIAGEGRRYMLQGFTGQRLESIARVTVDATDGLMSTTAGKLSFIEQLQANPVAQQDPNSLRNIYRVYRTGSMDPVLQAPEREDMLVKRENDRIAKGEVPEVAADDPHWEHIKGHREPIAAPDAREGTPAWAAQRAHVQKHIDALRTLDPAFLQGIGQVPLPPVPGMPDPLAMPPGGEEGGPPSAPPVEGADSGAMNPEDPVSGPAAPGGPEMPSLPVNPATGQRVSAA